MMTKLTGGGPNSRVVGNYVDRKVEPKSYAVDPGRAADIGMTVHYHKLPLHQGAGYSTPQGPTDNTQNLGPGGCGRQVLRSGSQAKTPSVTPPSKSKPFF
jgi:hypothetical protein